MSGAAWQEERARQISLGLARVRARIESACAAAGRDPGEVTLVAVTKFFPASDVRLLQAAGVTDIGESRDQEARAKLAGLAGGGPLPRVHFVGQLQTNKASSVVSYADIVESVDRARLISALERAAARAGRQLDVLLQVDLRAGAGSDGAGGPARGGARPAHVGELAALVSGCAHLRLRGLMSVAPRDDDPAAAFGRLAALRTGLLRAFPQAGVLSAGMSSDLEAGIAAGATHVRVGSAILGSRYGAG